MLRFLLFFLIVGSLILPVFAQGFTNSTMTDVTHTSNSVQDMSQEVSFVPTLWNIGIFAIIGSAITLIGILLSIRFVYIDKIHEERISQIRDDTAKELEGQEKLFDNNEFSKENVRWFAEYISSFYVALEDIKQRRRANSKNGVRIDIFCMGILFIIGAIATTGFFGDKFLILPFVIGIATFVSVFHFIIQLRRTKFKVDYS